MSLGFVVCFGILKNSVTNRKWIRGALIYVGSRIGHFVCYCGKILNNMLCVKIMFIYAINLMY